MRKQIILGYVNKLVDTTVYDADRVADCVVDIINDNYSDGNITIINIVEIINYVVNNW